LYGNECFQEFIKDQFVMLSKHNTAYSCCQPCKMLRNGKLAV